MSDTQLIVNADDFGVSEEVNEGVIRSFREGVLTSCSLMVSGDAFEQAVRLAKANPRLAVGIHLVAVCGRSVLSPAEIPRLVDREGRFSSNPLTAGIKYYFSRQARLQLRRELAAQFEKFQATGLPCSHIDGHQHFHIHPIIFDSAVRLGRRFGVNRLRVPEDHLKLALSFDGSRALEKRLYGLIFHLFSRAMKRRLAKEGFLCTDRVYGFFQTGRMSASYFLRVLEHLEGGRNEIYFHPAYYRDDHALSEEQRQNFSEYEALVNPQVFEQVRQRGIRLTTYRSLGLS